VGWGLVKNSGLKKICGRNIRNEAFGVKVGVLNALAAAIVDALTRLAWMMGLELMLEMLLKSNPWFMTPPPRGSMAKLLIGLVLLKAASDSLRFNRTLSRFFSPKWRDGTNVKSFALSPKSSSFEE
jgi:hypothetical protein